MGISGTAPISGSLTCPWYCVSTVNSSLRTWWRVLAIGRGPSVVGEGSGVHQSLEAAPAPAVGGAPLPQDHLEAHQ